MKALKATANRALHAVQQDSAGLQSKLTPQQETASADMGETQHQR